MKTIKKGTNKYYGVTCHGCDSDIEYQLSLSQMQFIIVKLQLRGL